MSKFHASRKKTHMPNMREDVEYNYLDSSIRCVYWLNRLAHVIAQTRPKASQVLIFQRKKTRHKTQQHL
jgi:hypothetical protein